MSEGGDGPERERLVRSLNAVTADMERMAMPLALAPLLTVDLTIQQLKVLTVVVTADDGETGRGLAARFGVSMPSMSGVIDRLVALDLTRRTDDPTDHRVRRIQATPLGRSVVQKLVARHPGFDADVVGALALDDLRALERGMRAVSAELSKTLTTP